LKLIYIPYIFVPAIPIFGHSAILISRYIFASLLQNYYILMIYQSIFAKISILFLTFAEN